MVVEKKHKCLEEEFVAMKERLLVLENKYEKLLSIVMNHIPKNAKVDISSEKEDKESLDSYIKKSPTGVLFTKDVTVTYVDDQKATFVFPTGHGFVIFKKFWKDTTIKFSDIEVGMKRDFIVSSKTRIDEPYHVRCFIGSLFEDSVRIQWKNQWGYVFLTGITNVSHLMNLCQRKISEPDYIDNEFKGTNIDETFELKILPYFLEKGGWKL